MFPVGYKPYHGIFGDESKSLLDRSFDGLEFCFLESRVDDEKECGGASSFVRVWFVFYGRCIALEFMFWGIGIMGREGISCETKWANPDCG